MGYNEDIEALDLADDVKQQLITAHRAEVDPLRQSNQTLAAHNRSEAVEAEIVALADAGFAESPGLLKYTRRILLSADAEEPGAVLLSDSEMGLSGDEATGATGREDISVAQAVRGFIERLPRTDEGKIQLSDQSTVTEDEERPGTGDKKGDTEGARGRLATLTGRDLSRGSRTKRYRTASVTGGGE